MSISAIRQALTGIKAPGYTSRELHENHDCGISQAACNVAISAMKRENELVQHGEKRPHSYTLRLPGHATPSPASAAAKTGKPEAGGTQPASTTGRPREVAGFVIETDVPMQIRVRGSAILEALNALQVGESFTHHRHINLRTYRARLKGKKFTQGIDPKDPKRARIRIWREA